MDDRLLILTKVKDNNIIKKRLCNILDVTFKSYSDYSKNSYGDDYFMIKDCSSSLIVSHHVLATFEFPRKDIEVFLDFLCDIMYSELEDSYSLKISSCFDYRGEFIINVYVSFEENIV